MRGPEAKTQVTWIPAHLIDDEPAEDESKMTDQNKEKRKREKCLNELKAHLF